MVHLDNLKELAKRFRLHKSIPNFFRDYTTEDSLVAVLKRYVRNNAAFLSLAPSVARAGRSAPQIDTGTGASGTGAASGADVPHTVGLVASMDGSNSLQDGGGTTSSGAITKDDSTIVSLADNNIISGPAGNHGGILSSDGVTNVGGAGQGGGLTCQRSKESGLVTLGSTKGKISSAGMLPRRPLQPKRQAKVG